MTNATRLYLPAAGVDLLLPLYDPMWKLFGGDRLRRTLFDQAAVQPHHRALDIGCGTGTFAIALKSWLPTLEIVGLDPDTRALNRSRHKAHRARVAVRFDRGFADSLPYADGSFDRVFSCFMFHHLSREVKIGMLQEARRVLEPGGSLHLVDFVREELPSRGMLSGLIHSSQHLRDNTRHQVQQWMFEAGFAQPAISSADSIFGKVLYFAAESRVQATV